MATKVVKRRHNHGDSLKNMDEVSEISDAITQPLLGDYDRDGSDLDVKDTLDKRNQECYPYWLHALSNNISQWAQQIASVFTGISSILKSLFFTSSINKGLKDDKKILTNLSPLQEERLRNLRYRLEVPFDSSCVDHQDALKKLWRLAYPNRELPPLKSELWKEMGWQGSDPSTDFRGGGFMSLENLIYFAKNYPDSFQRLLHKQDGRRSELEYPFAAAGINISYMLMQMLDLQSGKRISKVGYHFMGLLEEETMAFDELYCVAFQIMDKQWLEKQATYMQFNEVLKSTRAKLEQELTLEGITRIQDMPSYKMLSR